MSFPWNYFFLNNSGKINSEICTFLNITNYGSFNGYILVFFKIKVYLLFILNSYKNNIDS